MTSVFTRKSRGRFETLRHRGSRVKTEAEMGVMLLPDKDAEAPRSWTGQGGVSPQSSSGPPAHTFISDFWPPDCERIHFCEVKPCNVY